MIQPVNLIVSFFSVAILLFSVGSCPGCDRMIVGFTTTCAISAYHHYSCEFETRSWRGVLDTTWRDKVYQWLATGQRFFPETDDISEILLKAALNTINLNQPVQVKLTTIHIENGIRHPRSLSCLFVLKSLGFILATRGNIFLSIPYHCNFTFNQSQHKHFFFTAKHMKYFLNKCLESSCYC